MKDVSTQRSFYSSQGYRLKQSFLTRENWKRGRFDFLSQKSQRECVRVECQNKFLAAPSDPKKYCSRNCAAVVNNSARKWSEIVKRKISQALRGRESLSKGIIKVPRSEVICKNANCRKRFFAERWKKARFCSNQCVMNVVGRRPTSPRAARGKAGIRRDISPTIYFYSRWEANIARLYTYLGISWQYAPTTFDIGGHTYTPDFYLPETGVYVEVKNFWWKYSRIRDEKFRKLYKNLQLEVILKEHYLSLEKQYAHFIPNWEYKNSPFKTT